MARAGPKSRKGKAGPKSKKVVEKKVVEEEELVDKTESEGEEDEVVEKENDVKEEEESADNEDQSEDDEPPAKKGRGRPGAAKGSKKKASPVAKKAAGRPSSRGRKAPAAAAKATPKKKAESEEEEEEDGKEYEVEKILDSMKRGNRQLYYIKWKGFGKKDATWEPEDNLNCEEAIKEWEAKLDQRKKNPGVATRVERKTTDRYADIAGAGNEHRRRHSKRGDTKSPRKSYKEDGDSD